MSEPLDANGQALPTMATGPGEDDVALDAAARIAAAQAAVGQGGDSGQPLAGTTETDAVALLQQALAQLAIQQQQINQLLAQAGPKGPHPLLAVAKMLRHHLGDGEHRDAHAPAVALADDLIDAAGNAVSSGDLTAVRKIHAGLLKWLDRNPVPPGDSYHHRQAADIIRWHLGDQADSFVPAPKQQGLTSSQAPVRVVTGSVTG